MNKYFKKFKTEILTHSIFNERRQNIEEKEAQRQTANKLMMSLKLHQQQNSTLGLGVKSSLDENLFQTKDFSKEINNNIQNQINFHNSFPGFTPAICNSSGEFAFENNNQQDKNPLNKLMDMAFNGDNSSLKLELT